MANAREAALYEALGIPSAPRDGAPGKALESVPPPGAAPADSFLTLDGAKELERRFAADPDGTLARYHREGGAKMPPEQFADLLREVRELFEAPPEIAGKAVQERLQLGKYAAPQLPADYTFPALHPAPPAPIPLAPWDHRFEEFADAARWVITCFGPAVLNPRSGDRARFRFPKKPDDFTYPLRPGAEGTVRIALFADYGTGLYHSRYIAHQIVNGGYDYAIHLGDTYYAGTPAEISEYFVQPLAPMFGKTRLFAMPGNHEMYAGGAAPYLRMLEQLRHNHPGFQEQEATYFRLVSDAFQIVAIDTEYFERFRFKEAELHTWLRAVLEDGRSHKRTTILLTPDELFHYDKAEPTALHGDLAGAGCFDEGLFHLVFWGNVHYASLHDRSTRFPYYASCIGHAGFPYYRIRKRPPQPPSPLLWLETEPRFEQGTGVSQNLGNNGFCEMTLSGDGIVLRYIDWKGFDRCIARFSRDVATGAITVANVEELPPPRWPR